MTRVSQAWRRALALLVIAHGLTHAVMLRPAFDAANFMPFIVYCVAVVGFTAAGIGVFGVTPFAGFVRPLLVVPSGYSLVLLSLNGAGAAWWVAGLDIILLFTGLTGVYQRLPIGRSHPGTPHRVAVSAGTALVLGVFYAVVVWMP